MKKFYNNTLMRGAFSKALRLVALLCVLLGVSTTAWAAEAGLWSDNVIVVTINGNDISMGNNYTTHNLGTIASAPSITKGEVRVWKNGNGNICWDDVKLNVDGTDYSRNSDMTHMDNNNYKFTININKTFSNTAGSHTITLFAKAKGNENGSDGCGSSWQSTTCKITYTISGPVQTKYYAKYNWDGNSWTWKEFDANNQISGTYHGDCMNVDVSQNDGATCYSIVKNGTVNNGTPCTFTWNPTNKTVTATPTGGGGDDPDDPSDKPSCDVIEIWCKGVNSYTNMYCYAWHPDNNSDNPLGGWAGSPKQKEGTYKGETYAVWTVSNHDRLNVIFNNSTDGKNATCQTADIQGLVQGKRYIYTLPDSWCGQQPSSTVVVDCSGGTQDVENGTFYLDISSFKDWSKAGAIFKAELTTGSGTVEKDMIQCTSDANIFYIDELLNLKDYTKIKVKRCDPATGGQWNYSAELSVTNTATTCVKVTGWDNTGSLVKYTGECGVTTDTPVYLTNPAVVDADGVTVTMYGYLSETYCNAITEYGFVYCPGTKTQGCTPTTSSPKLVAGSGAQIYRGESFMLTTNQLGREKTYGYKAYVKIGSMMYLSAETGYFKLSDCTTRPVAGGAAITYTVNAALGESYEDDCTLTYGNLQTAIDRLKQSYNNDDIYQYVTKNGDSYNLRQPVVMKVHYYDDTPDDDTSDYIYRGTTNIGKYAGAAVPKNSNLLQDINRSGANAANTLTIKAGDKKAKPWVHHVVIRNSKNIVLDSLAIFSDPADYDADKAGTQTIGDNAIEMDADIAYGDKNWNTLNSHAYVENANIVVQNCMIGSDGFTGAHISSYSGVTFKNCDFESVFNDASGNAIAWGASFKLLYCKNIKFIQNNFRGDHATLMWIQEVQNMLVMNNVFWNTNKFLAAENQRNPAAMRLVTQWNKLKNVGFYYNTYYFANNNVDSKSTYDFMAFAEAADIDVSTVEFKYNNCYSYDLDCPGKSNNPFANKSIGGNYAGNFCPNNFWSAFDQNQNPVPTKSAFAFGECGEIKFINVASQVCSTTASGPASLQVKGKDMNLGIKPDITKTGITLTEDEWYSDRYLKDQRPKNGTEWTYGAYQSKENVDTQYIYWVGISEDWDDRNNWEYEVEDDKTRALVRQRLSCVNALSPNLVAVIEEKGTIEVEGGRKWPRIPESFTGKRSNQYDSGKNLINEHVSAGLGSGTETELFAKSIIVEAGAAIKGVEHLQNGSLHYQDATTYMNTPRSKWVLVGSVVKPFNVKGDVGSGVRNIKSGDYFKDYMPQVYMHKAEITGTGSSIGATWGATFPDLETSVTPETVFAINIPDEYGDYKLPAAYYNKYFGGNVNGEEPVEYQFNGRFADDAGMRIYSDLTAGVPTLINNTYPCNLDAREVERISGGSVLYYNYDAATFMSTASTADKVLLRPQHGFIFTPGAKKSSLTIEDDMLADGNTHSRSANITVPTISINLFNANTQKGFSNVVLHYDTQVDVTAGTSTDTEKVFAPNADSPELYIMANDKKYTRLTVGSTMVTVPLGIRLLKDMNVKFAPVYFEGLNEVILFDAFTGQTIDLLRNEFTTEVLMAGDIEGRYFLNIELKENDEYVPDQDDDVTTNIADATEQEYAINIYVNQAYGNEISIVTANVELETIYVSDMTGRTMEYTASGQSALLRLPVAQGVYVVQVVGDKLTRTEKVIIK
ncbi:MAG: T9SS type A sorting domain-containing protein [Paludibacteraceae bacterium]|nr:T9SS type A sorting domain-containing protein [Paludibacteraceae bacterium]